MDIALVGKVGGDNLYTLCNIRLRRVYVNFRLFWRLVWGRNASELCNLMSVRRDARISERTLDFARPRLLVQSLRISLLNDLQRRIHKHLDKWDARLCVDLPRKIAVLAVRRDERGDGHTRRIGEQLRHFSNPANVLVPRFFVESKVLVQSKTDIVAVQTVGEFVKVQKVLLKCAGYGGLF